MSRLFFSYLLRSLALTMICLSLISAAEPENSPSEKPKPDNTPRAGEERWERILLNKIGNKIDSNLDLNNIGDEDLSTTIGIRLDLNGELVKTQILKSSKNDVFDQRVVQAVENAAPFKLPTDKNQAARFARLTLIENLSIIKQKRMNPLLQDSSLMPNLSLDTRKNMDYPSLVLDMIQVQLDTYGIKNPFLSTEIRLELSRFGEIKALDIQHSSSDPWFDKRVIAAVNRAAPFFSAPLANKDYKKVRSLDLSIKNLKPVEKPVEQLVN